MSTELPLEFQNSRGAHNLGSCFGDQSKTNAKPQRGPFSCKSLTEFDRPGLVSKLGFRVNHVLSERRYDLPRLLD